MKKSTKWITASAICILVFIVIYFLYGALKENYTPDQLSENKNFSQEQNNNKNNKAPDFTVFDENGNEVQLSDFSGMPIVINFWASWCYYCKEEMPSFNNAFSKHPDVKFLMVNVTDGQNETQYSARKYIREEGYNFPIYYDKNLEASITYGASSLPMTVFIDKNGGIVTYASGYLTPENLEKGINMIK